MQLDFQQQNPFWINVSSLVKGMYILKIQTTSGTDVKKLVIQ